MPTDAEKRRLAFQRSVRRRFSEIDEEIRARHRPRLDALLGLSKEDIDAITPGATDLETYERLIAVVQEASRKNIAVADLRKTIQGMGEVAVAIAKKAGGIL